ncbi:hypothetical protein Pth03_26070 [Planotetraspora thailandica]|uniref:AB hydrolase-1 domain-containing protein n=1 Tax=Planotetraspora thailandica TaxID=487172 RepID=A0A8J3UZV5_9ACTN|nr:hypothetical protein Pth03_26070 [Planotetraspora thailandica]
MAISLNEQGTAVSRLVVVGEGPDYSVADPPAINALLRLPVLGPLLFRGLPPSVSRKVVMGFLAPGASVASAFDDVTQPVWDVRAVQYACFLGTQEEKERYVAERPLDVRIPALGTPALVIFGERDQVFRSAESCDRYRAMPDATVEVVPGAGHSPITEDPSGTAEIIRRSVAASGAGT